MSVFGLNSASLFEKLFSSNKNPKLYVMLTFRISTLLGNVGEGDRCVVGGLLRSAAVVQRLVDSRRLQACDDEVGV